MRFFTNHVYQIGPNAEHWICVLANQPHVVMLIPGGPIVDRDGNERLSPDDMQEGDKLVWHEHLGDYLWWPSVTVEENSMRIPVPPPITMLDCGPDVPGSVRTPYKVGSLSVRHLMAIPVAEGEVLPGFRAADEASA